MGDRKLFQKIGKYLVVFLISSILSLSIIGVYYLFNDSNLTIQKYLQSLEQASIKWKFTFKSWVLGDLSSETGVYKNPTRGFYQKMTIAAIDDVTIEANGSWPFNRRVWADTINYFNSQQDELIPLLFFDIIFAEASQNKESDQALFQAFKNYKGVIGEDIIMETFNTSFSQNVNSDDEKEFIELFKKRMIAEGYNYDSPAIQALKRFELKLDLPREVSRNIIRFPKIAPVMPEISEHLHFLGTANVDMRETFLNRKPLIIKARYYQEKDDDITFLDVYYPSVILTMATRLLQAEITDIVVKDGSITIKNALYKGKRIDFDIPVDKSFRMDINYKSAPASGYVNIVSLKDIQKVPLQKDGVVFIGMYSKKGPYDIKLTPMGDMYGIEFLAYALGTIMNRDFIKETPKMFDIIYIFVFALLIGFLVARGTKTTVAAGITSIVFPLGLGFSLFFNNIDCVTFIPLLTAVLVLVSVQIFIRLTEEKEKKFIKATFSSYLNPKLVDILIQNPEKIQLGGEEKEVTVFFSAVKNLADVTEGMSPKEEIEFLNSYFSKMADIVINTSGTLDKYIGDCVMAFWGAPIDLKGHALKACQASVKMMEAVRDFNDEQSKKGRKPIEVHIGLNTGMIVVGNVGSEQQKNYTAIGDSVNLASRVKGLNKYFHTHVVFTEFTYELVKDFVIARELDLTKVKGKSKPVRIYELFDVTNWD